MSEPVVVGVDVGGTKIVAAVVTPDGVCGPVVRVPTPKHDVAVLEQTLTDVVTAAATAAGAAAATAVGLSAAGFVDAEGRSVAFAPHLPWRDAPVRDRLSERWAVPVALENDATCAMVAESVHGAAQGRDSAVLLTLGTGIGGGLVVGGRVVRGAGGMAGEFGHMTVVPDGRGCECGGQGCWEQYCSGRALLRAAQTAAHGSTSRMSELCGGDPERLTGPMVTESARAGDPVALGVFSEVGRWLGLGLRNLVAALDPEVVVVGGGLGAAGDLLLDPAREELERRVVGVGHRTVPPVLSATTGPEAGLVGAAVLARRSLQN